MSLLQTLKYNLSNLLNFNGRQARGQFWPFAGSVVAFSFVGMMLIMTPAMNSSFARMHEFAREHPELATIEQGPGSYSISIRGHHPKLTPDFDLIVSLAVVMFALIAGLLAAAIARRLHDCNKRALWGLMPIPFVVFAGILMPRLFAQFGDTAPDMGLFSALLVNNFLYLGSLFFLVILLAGEGTRGDNRYGPRPPG